MFSRDRSHYTQSNANPTSGNSTPTGYTTPMRSPSEQHLATNQGATRIQLSQPYAYRSLDKVCGTVNHALIDADRVKIHLTGTTYILHSRFINGAYRPVEKSWEFLKLTKKYNLSSGAESVTEFSFRLPEALIETTCPLRIHFHLLLPPTVGCKRDDGLDDMSPKDPVNARIEYRIVAEMVKDGEIVQTLYKEFRVAPRHFSSPDAMNPPPGYDDKLDVEVEVNRTIGGKIGSMRIHGQSVPALLSSLEEHQLTTSIPLKLEFHSITTPPPKIQGIHLKLRAVTSSRIEHLLEHGEDIKRHTEVRLNKMMFSKHSAPIWRPLRPGVFETEIDVPATLCPKGFVAIPEFESCLVDRSYKLTLKFEMSAPGLPLSETRMTIPVWIFADEYYGLPSEARPGVPVKQVPRFTVPPDARNDEPGSLPNYEDTYLSNLANTLRQGPVVVGDAGTTAAPFSLSGMEPDYFARPRPNARLLAQAQAQAQVRPHRAGAGAGVGPSTATVTSAQTEDDSGSITGIDPTDNPEDEDEVNRVPAWMAKELERPSGQFDPRDQDGAQ